MMRMTKRPWLGLALVAAPAAAAGLYPLATLQAQVERFAGQPALIDGRLLLPDCAAPDLGWAVPGRSVRVHCSAPEWQVFVSVGSAAASVPAPDLVNASVPAAATLAPARPLIRRGDRVMVEAGGAGFTVAMEAIAEGDSRDGRVTLRASGGDGRRLAGVVLPDGRVTLHGLNPPVNGR
ncbi:MAG: hypothetical protein RL490_1344 [Pseudomonadota bacterium]|jgi:flagella basal body P-ring formation protein FlgA